MSELAIDDLDLDFVWAVLLRHGAERRAREAKMPSKSEKQAKLMRAAAHDPKFAKAAGVPVSVAKEFVRADQSKRAAVLKPPAPGRDRGAPKRK